MSATEKGSERGCRENLAERRQSEILSFKFEEIPITARVSRFADGRVAEVFLDAGIVGSSTHTMAKDAAVVLSIALQYGAPLAVIRGALSQELDGKMRGPVGIMLQLLDAVQLQ